MSYSNSYDNNVDDIRNGNITSDNNNSDGDKCSNNMDSINNDNKAASI